LRRDNINGAHVDEILELVRNKHYQLACTKHFEVTHPQNKEKIDNIEHPNAYYELSKRLAETEKASEGGPLADESMEIDD
jgi:DNA primase large subunit